MLSLSARAHTQPERTGQAGRAADSATPSLQGGIAGPSGYYVYAY